MDINADVGEGFGAWRCGDDDGMLSIVTSANVACGFHGGDPSTMRRVCQLAIHRGVAVGAQVGYRDLAGFGRRHIDYEVGELRDEVIYQIGALDGMCRVFGERVRYVKPHGALYHAAATDAGQAGAVVAAITDYDPTLAVLCQTGTVLAIVAADAGLRVVAEGFVDRGYRGDATLVPRTQPGAVLSTVDKAVRQGLRLASFEEIETVDGQIIAGRVESLCVHGDTPGAVDLARAVRTALAEAGIPLAPFVSLD